MFFSSVMSDIVLPSQRFVLDDVLEDIQVPLLCIWGTHDKVWLCFFNLYHLCKVILAFRIL